MAELAAVRSRRAKLMRWLGAGGAGTLLALAFFNHAVRQHVAPLLDRVLILVYLLLLFTLAGYVLLFRVALPRLRAASPQARLAWGLGALAAGCFLAAVLARQPAQPRPHTLELIATGQRNPAARGSEVWVTGLYRADGSQVAVAELVLVGDWEIRDGVPLSYRNQPATLRWTGVLDGDAVVRLVAHPWSGIIQLRWDDQTQTIDLYADPATTKEIVLPNIPAAGGPWAPVLRAVFLSADAFSLGLLMFVLGPLFAGERAPARRLAWAIWHRRWVLVPVLALPLAWLIAPLILSDGVPGHGLRPIDYTVAWLYAVGLLGVCVCLSYDSDRLFALVPARFPRRLRWLGNIVFGQPLGAWLLAAPAAIVIAVLLVGRAGIGGQQHAVWVKLALDTRSGEAPAAQLRYGPADGDVVPFQWQPYAESIVAVRPFDQQPLQLVAIETDQGPLPLDRVTVTPGERRPAGLIINPVGSLLSWSQPSRAITLTLAAGSGRAEVLWFDQQTTAALGAQPVRAMLRLPAAFQGWALVPPQEIRQLRLEFPAKDDVYTIRELAVWSDPPQESPGEAAAAWSARGCEHRPEATGVIVLATTAGAACSVQVPDVWAINVTNHGQRFLAIALVAMLGLGLLRVLTLLANYGRRLTASYSGAENALGGWLRRRTEHWRLGRAMWFVWGVALAFHLLYALTVPLAYTNDSVDYYSLGRAFAQAPWFASVDTTVRTPGYPVFIASVLAIFGDTALWIVIVQHLALSLLAPLAVWALARYLPLPAAALAGLLAGIAPALATTANILWTESLYAALTTAALLVYARSGDRLRGLLVAGMLVGAATMVRPTGLLVLLVLLGWLLLCGWCSSTRATQQRFALAGCAALLAGYVVTAGPWHLRLGLVDGTTDLSKGHANFTAWGAAVYQRRIDATLAINRPKRAIWAVPQAWRYDPFTLTNLYLQLRNGSTIPVEVYYAEALREAARANPLRLRENLRSALIYNLTLKWTGDNSYVYWAEISWFLKYWDAPVQELPPATSSDPVRQQLDRMVYRWQSEQAPMRSSLIGMSRFVLEHWIWLSIPVMLSGGFLLAPSLLRRVVPGWLYWIGLVIAATALGMPAERYVVVIEPVLYIIVGVLLYAVACLRYRSTTHVAPVEAVVTPARVHEA
jgi:hypothetical protein